MISIIITSFREPHTIGKAIEAILGEHLKDYEIIITAPDNETLNVAKRYSKKGPVALIKDRGEGKPAALSKAFKEAKGSILVLTDGDVHIRSGSLRHLLAPFISSSIGAVSARVKSTNSKNSLFGYWAYVLTEVFHKSRMHDITKNKPILCSGYLYAVRSNLVRKIPSDILADDAFISYNVIEKGYKICYEPRAEVYVRYPTTLPDWIRQKKRTAGRFYQLEKIFHLSKTRSFLDELTIGLRSLALIGNIREGVSLLLLGCMKMYIWSRVFLDVRLWNRHYKNVWERVNTTK
jgi:cellulose synthase/poly-beta-1,6-N-acetylglucosamine synthase-like glycosyltransferase